jgi:predicted transglutaminase-like cysteine proteinase
MPLTSPARILFVCLAVVSLPFNTVTAADWQQRRIDAWQKLITDHQSDAEQNKVRLVNQFVNQMQYVDDAVKWGRRDYWATPLEFLAANGGDCEDFAIAKYFTLKSMGVPESRLRMVYVKSRPAGQSHMVLEYFPEKAGSPVVLDNDNNQLITADKRTDLVPVYSFNRRSYWLSRPDGSQQYIGSAQRLSRWKEVLDRWEKNTAL